jgi:hypothetical protein
VIPLITRKSKKAFFIAAIEIVAVSTLLFCSENDEEEQDHCTESGNWYDANSGLCWQNPPPDQEFTWEDAALYCDNLSLGGFDDWRLPDIQELISIMRGCVDGDTTGDLSSSECGVTDPDCLNYDCLQQGCKSCDPQQGPDNNPPGWYWDPELEDPNKGACYFSSSMAYEVEYSSAWVVCFGDASISPSETAIAGPFARCVRDEQ